MKNVIFEEDICDAKKERLEDICDAKVSETPLNVLDLTCRRGKLKVEGNVTTLFWAYHNWCKGCSAKHIVNKKELQEVAKAFMKNVTKVLEEET